MIQKQHPCIYEGHVMHKRLIPFIHEFVYRVFYLWLDLDHIDATAKSLKLFSLNRFNVYSFHDKDHGKRDGSSIRPWIETHLQQKDFVDCIGGKIFVLCYPRIFGYVFNPLTLYFCYNHEGILRAILHEVKNTFGDQHGYLLAVPSLHATTPIQQHCTKIFHVSPFLSMPARYDFTLQEPDETLSIVIKQTQEEGLMLVAGLTGKKKSLSDKRLLLNLIRYPLMTVKIIASIHYEAFHLWRKGAKFFCRPEPPLNDVS
jgi:DUF1365 family protein